MDRRKTKEEGRQPADEPEPMAVSLPADEPEPMAVLLPEAVAVRYENAEPVAEAEAVVIAQAPKLPWTLSTWSGLPQWRCTLCPFDTLDGEDAMIEHIENRHGAIPAAAPLVQAYDARGNPI